MGCTLRQLPAWKEQEGNERNFTEWKREQVDRLILCVCVCVCVLHACVHQ